MPYIDEHEFSEIQKKIENIELTQKELRQKNEALKSKTNQVESTEKLLEEKTKTLNKNKKKATFQNILLSLITGISLAFAYHYFNNNGDNINIQEIKQLEASRVLDSINSSKAHITDTNSHDNDDTEADDVDTNVEVDVDTDISAFKTGVNGKKVYSVQIGVFDKKEYVVLSDVLAGISSKKEMFKYSLGLFKTLKEAQDFRRELVKIGFNDSFVASYINGKRQAIEKPN